MINDGTAWTAEQTAKLAGLFFTDPKPSIGEMAATMGRTPYAVWTQIARLAMSTPGAKLRKCLPCDRPFYSSHIGNRMCQHCLESQGLRCA